MPQDPQHEDLSRDKREQRAMWIFSGLIVVLICGAMGAKMLFSSGSPSVTTEISSQSRTTPAK